MLLKRGCSPSLGASSSTTHDLPGVDEKWQPLAREKALLSIALMRSWTASWLRTRWRRSPTSTVKSSSVRTSLVRAFLKFRDGLASQKEPRNRGSTTGCAG